jgi:hypothetical protein
MTAREYPADEREWTLPAGQRVAVVARRLWPSLVVGLIAWLAWAALRRRRRRSS